MKAENLRHSLSPAGPSQSKLLAVLLPLLLVVAAACAASAASVPSTLLTSGLQPGTFDYNGFLDQRESFWEGLETGNVPLASQVIENHIAPAPSSGRPDSSVQQQATCAQATTADAHYWLCGTAACHCKRSFLPSPPLNHIHLHWPLFVQVLLVSCLYQ